MNKKLKIRAIGNSYGVIFPAEALEKLRSKEGDEIFMTETPNGIEFSQYDPEIQKQFEAAEEVMNENKDVLRRLAK